MGWFFRSKRVRELEAMLSKAQGERDCAKFAYALLEQANIKLHADNELQAQELRQARAELMMLRRVYGHAPRGCS